MAAALEGLRILDLGQWIAAPYCAAMLADFGADVIKIEKPDGGDDQRRSGPVVDGESAFFRMLNRNKRSMVLDLAADAGRAQCRALMAAADVVIENYRPGALAKLGLDAESARRLNPRLIYCSISGFGQSGMLRDQRGFDLVAQAMSGLASVCGKVDGPPQKMPIPIVDVSTALFAMIGILIAVAARERTGEGQTVDVSLIESALAIAPLEVAQYLSTGSNPPRLGESSRNASPYQLFRTRDGALALGAAAQHLWEQCCSLLGRSDLVALPQFATNALRMQHNDELASLLQSIFERETTAHWVDLLGKAGIPVGPVLKYDEILNHPHIQTRELIRRPEGQTVDGPRAMVAPIRLSATPARLVSAGPTLGEHTADVLASDRGWPARM